MQIQRRLRRLSPAPQVVAIGNFDGIHRGHQYVLQLTATIAQRERCRASVLTFEPCPKQFFQPGQAIPRLTTLREKIAILQTFHLDNVYAMPFDVHLSQFSAMQFIEEILVRQLNAKHIVVGEDFRFGYQRQGSVALLQSISVFHTQIAPSVQWAGERISSTRVRQALKQGDLVLARDLLGRDYFIIGRVVHGDKRGRQLGFPTANIALTKRRLVLTGVFAVIVDLDGQCFQGIANMGKRPTVGGQQAFLEVHLFGFSKDIYGKYLQVTFLKKMRDEQYFPSLDALRTQITHDIGSVKQWFMRL